MGKYSFNEHVRQVYLDATLIVVADIETTGFSGTYDEILEIGAVVLDTKTGKIARGEDGKPRRFSCFVRPISHKKVPPVITEVTSITDEDVFKNGTPRNYAIKAFGEFISDMPVAFHNASFDWERFLIRDFEACGLRPTNEIVCTMELAKHLYPGMKKYNLEVMTQKFGFPIGAAHHRAVEDCKYTAGVLMKMLQDLAAEPIEEQQLSLAPENTVTTLEHLVVYRGQRWKKGAYDRVYFQTNLGSVFYDLKKQNWSVKDLRSGLQKDIISVSQMILSQIGVSEDDLATKFPA